MKYILLSLILILSVSGLAQKKIKYRRDVYSLIKEEKFEEVTPNLEKFLSQNSDHVNANYWAGKIFEARSYDQVDKKLANKAKEHYITCRNNVTVLEMNVLNSSRYPDVSGLDGEERLFNFNNFLRKKISSLGNFGYQIKRERINKKFTNEEEFITLTNVQLPDEIKNLNIVDIESNYEIIKLGNKKRIEGYLAFEAISPATKEKVIFQGNINDGVISENYTLKKYKIKPEVRSVNDLSLAEFEKMLNFKFLKYLGYSVRKDEKLTGTMSLISINNKYTLSGDYNLTGENLEITGDYDGKNGYLISKWMNYDTYGTDAIRLTIENGTITNFRYEVKYNGPLIKFYETSTGTDTIKSNDYNYFNLTTSEFTEIKSESQILKYVQYVNNEDEGADIITIGYSFSDKSGKNIFINESDIPEELRTRLGKDENYGSWYIVKYSLLAPETKLHKNIEPRKEVVGIKKTEVFDLKTIADEYDKKLNSSELTQLNSLGRKWVQSIKEGDYELYKSVIAKPYQETLKKFTEMTEGLKEVRYNEIDNYVIGRLIHAYDDHIGISFSELVKSGADESISVLTTYNIESYNKAKGTFRYIKYKGNWKIAFWYKNAISKNNILYIKALSAISKNPPSMCDYVNETAKGNQFVAQKGMFYFMSLAERKKVIDEFVSCLNEKNFCNYMKTAEEMEILGIGKVSIFELMNEMYFTSESKNKKIEELEKDCR